jgi:multiple sugar transport system substrate-binding protein
MAGILTTRRGALRAAAAAAAPAWLLAGRPPALAQGARPFQGVTLNVSCWSAPYARAVADYLPEFTQATGIRVNYDTPGFPIYNQRADLELSTRGSAFDVLNVTFIYTSRWIGAGWFTPLDAFLGNPDKTAADFDVEDFLPGLRRPESDKAGRLHAIP